MSDSLDVGRVNRSLSFYRFHYKPGDALVKCLVTNWCDTLNSCRELVFTFHDADRVCYTIHFHCPVFFFNSGILDISASSENNQHAC